LVCGHTAECRCSGAPGDRWHRESCEGCSGCDWSYRVSAFFWYAVAENTNSFIEFYLLVGLYNYGTLVLEAQKVCSSQSRSPPSFTKSHFESKEKTLKTLLQQQRTKIEDIKKKTNYYTTRNLLERYDESPSLVNRGVPAPSDPNSALHRLPGGPPTTPQRQAQPSNMNTQTPSSKETQPALSSTLKNHLAGTTISCCFLRFILLCIDTFPFRKGTPQPIQPLRKQWYDKLADALLGDDESPVTAAASRYALICERCFNHNGLVKESMWEDARECFVSNKPPTLYAPTSRLQCPSQPFCIPFTFFTTALTIPDP